jgi:hypothetical protein
MMAADLMTTNQTAVFALWGSSHRRVGAQSSDEPAGRLRGPQLLGEPLGGGYQEVITEEHLDQNISRRRFIGA